MIGGIKAINGLIAYALKAMEPQKRVLVAPVPSRTTSQTLLPNLVI
jgi:hypothetical protein